MTRPTAEIEAELASARQAHADHLEALQSAKDEEPKLIRRIKQGDVKVTAADLAKATANLRFLEFGVEPKLQARRTLEEELKKAHAHQFADEVGATQPALREAVDLALADLKPALERIVNAWLTHSQEVNAVTRRGDHYTGTEHVTRNYQRNLVVDGTEIVPVPIQERLHDLYELTARRLVHDTTYR